MSSFAEIAEKYKTETVVESGPEPVIEEVKEFEQPGDAQGAASYPEGMGHTFLYDFFDIPGGTNLPVGTKTKLERIFSFLEADTKEDIDIEMSKIESKIPMPMPGVSRIDNILRYLTLRGEASKAFGRVKDYETIAGSRD